MLGRDRSPVRRGIRRNRSADNQLLLPMVNSTKGRRAASGDEGSTGSTPRLRRNRSSSSDADILMEDNKYGAHAKFRTSHRGYLNNDNNSILIKIVVIGLMFIGAVKFVLSTDHTASKVRGIYCPKEYPDPFSKCTLPFGTECPFQCINMPIYNKEGKCTGEVQCTPEKHCTCDESRGGEWFCFGGRTHKDDECKSRNYEETYEPCLCPRTFAQRT